MGYKLKLSRVIAFGDDCQKIKKTMKENERKFVPINICCWDEILKMSFVGIKNYGHRFCPFLP